MPTCSSPRCGWRPRPARGATLAALLPRRAGPRRALPRSGESAVDRFVCAEYLNAAGKSAERVATLLDEALTADANFGPALGLRAVLLADHGKLSRAMADAE